MTRAVSPVTILLVFTALTLALATWTLQSPGAAPHLAELLWREQIDLSAFTATGAVWLAIACSAYCLADYTAASHLRGHALPVATVPGQTLCAAVILVNTLFLLTILAWLLVASHAAGGLARLVQTIGTQPIAARDVLLEAKLFPGMRLFYAGLSGTSALIYALVVGGNETISARQKRLSLLLLCANGVVLVLLPLVMSQRLLLLHAMCALVITDVLIRKRTNGFFALVIGAVVFLGVWLGREALTNATLSGGAVSVGLQKLLFYSVNDLWNGFAPLAEPIPHTYGALTLRAPAVLLSLDGALAHLAAPQLEALEHARGGGEFPLLTMAYVDFGPIGGVIALGLLASALRWVFWRAHNSHLFAAIYAQLGAALVLAPHASYVLHQNVLFSILTLVVLHRLSRGKLRRFGPEWRDAHG